MAFSSDLIAGPTLTGVEFLQRVASQIGFDGVDLTVRPGGHVLPERVREDLPRAVKVIRGAGLETPMITTEIMDASGPHTGAILETAARLGILHYRWGGFKYTNEKSIPSQLDVLKPRVKALAELRATTIRRRAPRTTTCGSSGQSSGGLVEPDMGFQMI